MPKQKHSIQYHVFVYGTSNCRFLTLQQHFCSNNPARRHSTNTAPLNLVTGTIAVVLLAATLVHAGALRPARSAQLYETAAAGMDCCTAVHCSACALQPQP
jgi:hypothetical protein